MSFGSCSFRWCAAIASDTYMESEYLKGRNPNRRSKDVQETEQPCAAQVQGTGMSQQERWAIAEASQTDMLPSLDALMPPLSSDSPPNLGLVPDGATQDAALWAGW